MRFLYLVMVLVFFSCQEKKINKESHPNEISTTTKGVGVSLILLGTLQDAGAPQLNCNKKCCQGLFEQANSSRKVSSLGLLDFNTQKKYIFDATPDISSQLHALKKASKIAPSSIVDGIFLTHAHIGHYTGLMYLGKEAVNASEISVFAMPKMSSFLSNNGPWSQLVANRNIQIQSLVANQAISLSPSLQVTPFIVPHRDEYSETVGYLIEGPNKKALFIPDIDKWNQWELDLKTELKKVDYAFLDATFYSAKELGNRDMTQIPHPSVLETMEALKDISIEQRARVIFTHFNHTNPLLNRESEASKNVLALGFKIGRIHERFPL
ncbi:MAG: MBL fold metallo-hydrolase [Flavobacteriales bacterium]|nr:MAG: MBL fold metallo-hydrolase [Flavobacteriales bacterium]